MAKLFSPNLDRFGRLLRALWGILLLAAAVLVYPKSKWLAGIAAAGGLLAFFEAFRGWCVLRACGIKTKY